MAYRHLFGPVRSRRLGRSLGIDLLPDNTCSFDCIYCERGKTNNLTLKRAEYTPTDEILTELDNLLSTHPHIDFITLGGTGEPTLHSGIGTILWHIREEHPKYKSAILTNSTLLPDPTVRSALSSADLILPSLNAVSNDVFETINRPAPGISSSEIIEGLIRLREEYSGQIWLEIFLIPGINTTDVELHLLREAVIRIRPDQIHLNSLDRPGAEGWVIRPSDEELEKICQFFKVKLNNVTRI